MAAKKPRNGDLSQAQQFLNAARGLGCDESENAFNAALGKIAKHKPPPDEKPKAKKDKPAD